MRRVPDHDLAAGALALAYSYCGLPDLRSALAELESPGGPPDVIEALARKSVLSLERADKLRRAARLACLLRDDAVYGMIALRNRLVGTSMLNACMEESRRTGFTRNLADLLLEKGVVTPPLDRAVQARRKSALESLTRTETDLVTALDLGKDDDRTVESKLAILFGEVASKLTFLTREELDACLKAEERVQKGLPAEEAQPAAVAETAEPVQEVAVPVPAPSAGPNEDEPIKGYQLLERLGVGAMGAVLKARKKDSGEIVALKILKPELAKDAEFVQRFNREALAVQALNHPNIIRAVQVGKSGDYNFFAMEFVDGETASKLIKTRGKLPERLALGVTRQIAAALEHAWRNRIIHRDIKPDNIMVTREGGIAKLTDLGLARTVKQESTLTITGVVMGSPAYISPEQATGEKNLDTRSDIYALGATLFHMLTGEVPYDGDSPLQVMLRHMNDPLPDVRKKDPSISEPTRKLIFKMMAKRPEGRFQSSRDLHEAITQIERHLYQGGPPPTFLQPAAPPQVGGVPLAGRPTAPSTTTPNQGQPARKAPARPAGTSSEDAREAVGAGRPKTGTQPRASEAAPTAEKDESAERRKELGERLRKVVGKKRRPV